MDMTTRTVPTAPRSDGPPPSSSQIPGVLDPSPHPRRRDLLTVAAGWATLAICLLHTLAFSVHPYWGDWLAGPLRSSSVTMAEAAQFWGLPGGFVVPGAILGLLIIRLGRRGQMLPAYVGWVLALWAAVCLWMIGPSGFVFVLVPATLLIIAGLRSSRCGRELGSAGPDDGDVEGPSQQHGSTMPSDSDERGQRIRDARRCHAAFSFSSFPSS